MPILGELIGGQIQIKLAIYRKCGKIVYLALSNRNDI